MSAHGKKVVHEESGEKVPLWIISFADMITLLLSFFVMLQTMAHERSPVLFQAGQGSFNRSLAGLGIPNLLFGKQLPSGRDYRKIKYPTAESTQDPPPLPSRIIDARDEDIRALFEDLRLNLDTQTDESRERIIDTRPTPIRFPAEGCDLNDAAREYLKGLAVDLRQGLGSQQIRVYVVGCVEGQGKEQMLLAARRAAAVEEHLRPVLGLEAPERPWELYSLAATTSPACPGGQVTDIRPVITILVRAKAN